MSKKIKITYFVLFALITSCIYMSVFSNTSVSKSSTESQNVLEKQEKPRFSSLSTDNGTIYPNVTMGDFVIYSDFVKDNFTMYVSLPADYNISSSQEYPVIYLLDGDWYFSQARFIISKLITDRFMPPAILVGVG
ncbi:MAG: alpha/beta hydrolase-fold protein, partial [Candidatus Hodarchaeota archaeon]